MPPTFSKPLPYAPAGGIILSASYFSSVMVVSLSVMLWTAWASISFFSFMLKLNLLPSIELPQPNESYSASGPAVFQSHCFALDQSPSQIIGDAS
jgi:hypothetical protein